MKIFDLKKEYKENIVPKLLVRYPSLNIMSVPKISKIVINRGLGQEGSKSKILETSIKQFMYITGQKPLRTTAKKSISNFKLREGQVIGCKVTLRGRRMYDFLTKLINISIPKIRDFRGIPRNSFDGSGNYTLGIKEDVIFPEIQIGNLDKYYGFDISFVTNTDSDAQAFSLLELLGMPFRKK